MFVHIGVCGACGLLCACGLLRACEFVFVFVFVFVCVQLRDDVKFVCVCGV